LNSSLAELRRRRATGELSPVECGRPLGKQALSYLLYRFPLFARNLGGGGGGGRAKIDNAGRQ